MPGRAGAPARSTRSTRSTRGRTSPTHHLEQPAGQRDISPVMSTFRQRLKTFSSQASFPDIIIDPW